LTGGEGLVLAGQALFPASPLQVEKAKRLIAVREIAEQQGLSRTANASLSPI